MTNSVPENPRAAGLMREVDDLRRRQEAVANILRALSHGRIQLQSVLDQIVQAATRLCRSDSCLLWLARGDVFDLRASFAAPAEMVDYERLHPAERDPRTLVGRIALTRAPVHITDVYDDPGYSFPAVELGAYRTLLGLPVLVEDELAGLIGIAREEVRPFDESEIDLMATFADQSAIAIGNARLFETVERQRTELSRFLSPEVAALISSDDGARLLAGHRAYITVVYFDLRGFTSFVERAEPEELIDVVREYHSVAGELVAAHGGTVEHFAGDGLMVFFNDPVPLPEHEAHAARLAVDMRERVGGLATGWRRRGYDLGLGAGIAVGYATLGRIGFEGRYDYGALGNVTNLAARLSDQASAGQVLLSQRAHAALDGRIEAEPVAPLWMKGMSRPVEAFRLVSVLDH
jgi:class 3 adenylate cyclase